MNDMNNYDDELFLEEEEEFEEEQKKPAGREKLLKIGLIAVVAAVIVVVVLVTVLLKSNSGNEETTTLPVSETTTIAAETTTSPAEKYSTGKYTVNVAGNGTLNVRKEASMDSDPLTKIPNNTQINITEIKYDETADESSRYWGKTSYLGHDGWVAMQYLAAAYIDNTVEATTGDASSEASTSESAEATTKSETTTAASSSEATTAAATEATTASSSTSAGSTGTYKINSPDVGYLNMREGHSTDTTSIVQIPDGAEVKVVEVYESTDPDAAVKKWGKVSYSGQTGWVSMDYLTSAE